MKQQSHNTGFSAGTSRSMFMLTVLIMIAVGLAMAAITAQRGTQRGPRDSTQEHAPGTNPTMTAGRVGTNLIESDSGVTIANTGIRWPNPVPDSQTALEVSLMMIDPEIEMVESVVRLVNHEAASQWQGPVSLASNGNDSHVPVWIVGIRGVGVTRSNIERSMGMAIGAIDPLLTSYASQQVDGVYVILDANGGHPIAVGDLEIPDGVSDRHANTFSSIQSLSNMAIAIASSTALVRPAFHGTDEPMDGD